MGAFYCQSILLSKRAEVKKILDDASRKSKKGYKISGNRNLFSVRYWSKSEDMRMWDVARSDAARLPCNEERQLGGIERKIQERGKVIGMDPRKSARSSRESGKG